jgi:hypothetical protein
VHVEMAIDVKPHEVSAGIFAREDDVTSLF